MYFSRQRMGLMIPKEINRVVKWNKLIKVAFGEKKTHTKNDWVRQHFFVKIDHEIFSTAILSRLLIQEGQMSISGDRMCMYKPAQGSVAR